MHRVRHQVKAGFTLIELLVVIGIIALAASIIISMGSPGDGPALSSSQRILSSLVQGARSQAVLKSAEVRLIINNDKSDLDKYRRYVGAVYWDTDQNGVSGWVACNQGTYLPEGIYFDAVASAAASNWSLGNTMNLSFPRLNVQQEGDGVPYYYYTFNDNGTVKDTNPWMVLRAATMIPSGELVDELRVDEEQEYLRAALILRRSGTTTIVNDPNSSKFTQSGGKIQ